MCSFGAAGAGFNILQNVMDTRDIAHQTKNDAKAEKQEADLAYDNSRRDSEKQIARQHVAYANGGVTDEGTPADVLADASRDADVEARSLRSRGYRAARDTAARGKQAVRGKLFDSLRQVGSIGDEIIAQKPWKWGQDE